MEAVGGYDCAVEFLVVEGDLNFLLLRGGFVLRDGFVRVSVGTRVGSHVGTGVEVRLVGGVEDEGARAELSDEVGEGLRVEVAEEGLEGLMQR